MNFDDILYIFSTHILSLFSSNQTFRVTIDDFDDLVDMDSQLFNIELEKSRRAQNWKLCLKKFSSFNLTWIINHIYALFYIFISKFIFIFVSENYLSYQL